MTITPTGNSQTQQASTASLNSKPQQQASTASLKPAARPQQPAMGVNVLKIKQANAATAKEATITMQDLFDKAAQIHEGNTGEKLAMPKEISAEHVALDKTLKYLGGSLSELSKLSKEPLSDATNKELSKATDNVFNALGKGEVSMQSDKKTTSVAIKEGNSTFYY